MYNGEWYRETYAFYKSIGRCTRCRKADAVKGKTMCLSCLEDSAIKQAKRRARLTGEKKAAHAEASRQSNKRRVEKLKAAGLCVRCGKKPAWHGLQMCYECRLKKMLYFRRKTEERKQAKPAGACRFCNESAIAGKKVCMAHYQRLVNLWKASMEANANV